MNKNKLNIFLLALLITIPSIYALPYDYAGYNSFIQGNGTFNSARDPGSEVDYETALLTTPKLTPLIDDVDNNGIQEIFILDGTLVKVFQGRSLTLVSSLAVTGMPEFTNALLFDIDNDSQKEFIIFSRNNRVLNVMDFNQSAGLTLQTNIQLATGIGTDAESMIQCVRPQSCVIIHADAASTNSGTSDAFTLSARAFNTTNISATTTTITSYSNVASRTHVCMPEVRSIAVENINPTVDSFDDYVFSGIAATNLGSESILWFAMNQSSGGLGTLTTIASGSTGVGNFDGDGAGSFSCASSTPDMGRTVTAPIVYDFLTGSNKEVVMGTMTSTTTFVIKAFSFAGSVLDTHPATIDQEGTLVGNPIRMNAFPSNTPARDDYCVVGSYSTLSATPKYSLLCGSLLHSFQLSDTIRYDMTPTYNISSTAGSYNIIAHAAQHDSSLDPFDDDNLDELVSTYGIMKLDVDVDDSLLEVIFAQPEGDAVVLSNDVEQTNLDDLIVMTATNLWYLDDQFFNSPAEIAEITTNPCINDVMQLNTTFEIRVDVDDADNNPVGAEACLYCGSIYERNQTYSIQYAAGTTFTFSFTVNQTVGSGTLKLQARDTENNQTPDVINLPFSVSSIGAEFGDTTCTQNFAQAANITTGQIGNLTLLPDRENNAITNTLATFNDDLNLGIGGTLMYLIIMFGFAVAIFLVGMQNGVSIPHLIMGIGFVETMLFIIGSYLGLIPIIIWVTVLLLAVAAVAFWFIRPTIGGNG